MTPHNDVDFEHALNGSDPTMHRVVSDLQRACTTSMPDTMRSDIARQLATHSRIRPVRPTTWRVPYCGRVRLYRLASLASAVAVLLSLTVGYFRLQSPTPVSAAQILQRGAAAMADVPAGHVVHEITHIHTTLSDTHANQPKPNDDVTMEQWTQVDAHGHPLQFDLQATSPNPDLEERTVGESGGTMWTFGAKPDVVTKSTWTPGTSPFGPPPKGPEAILFLPKDTMYKPQDPAAMGTLLTAAASGADGSIHLLPRQTVDGHTVDVVQVTHNAGTNGQGRPAETDLLTIYLDAATHLVRRIDAHTTILDSGIRLHGSHGQVPLVSDQSFDVTTYLIVPMSQVPAGTFTFTPAPGTKVCTPAAYTGPGGTMNCTTIGSR